MVRMLWDAIKKNLQETVQYKGWMASDLPTSQSEKIILEALIFNFSIASPSSGTPNMSVASPLHWEPPPNAVFKMKFYGDSKGNPRKAGYGGAIRDHNGNIIHLFLETWASTQTML